MYLLNSLLLKSNKQTIEKVYSIVCKYLCQDDSEDIELNDKEIQTNKEFIERLSNTIIDQDDDELYYKVMSIYQ